MQRIEEDLLEIREALRRSQIALREELPAELRHASSMEIIQRLERHLAERGATFIHCYISFRSEVETRAFITAALEVHRWRVVVPVVEQGAEVLVHTEIQGLDNLAKGRFGLEEPVDRTPASLESLNAVIVPLVAFDRRGTRLGYGKGFYDAFLRELPDSVERIGLAFAVQEAEHIPLRPHDEPLDLIITEREFIRIDPTC